MSDLRLMIPERIYTMVMRWVDMAPGEVAGIGNVIVDPENPMIYRVTATVLPRQVARFADVESDPAAHGEALYRLQRYPGVPRWYWHSHGSMGVFWSGTDTEHMKQFKQPGYTFETVFNKARCSLTAYTQGQPFIVLNSVDLVVESAFHLNSRDQQFCETEWGNVKIPRRRGFRARRSQRALSDDTMIPDAVFCKDGVYYDTNGNQYELEADPNGEFYLTGRDGVTFNLADTEDLSEPEPDAEQLTAGGNGTPAAFELNSLDLNTQLSILGGQDTKG
jgi:hypothetical protein